MSSNVITLLEKIGVYAIWSSTHALEHRVGQSKPVYLVGRFALDGVSCGGPQDACKTLCTARTVAAQRANRYAAKVAK